MSDVLNKCGCGARRDIGPRKGWCVLLQKVAGCPAQHVERDLHAVRQGAPKNLLLC